MTKVLGKYERAAMRRREEAHRAAMHEARLRWAQLPCAFDGVLGLAFVRAVEYAAYGLGDRDGQDALRYEVPCLRSINDVIADTLRAVWLDSDALSTFEQWSAFLDVADRTYRDAYRETVDAMSR